MTYLYFFFPFLQDDKNKLSIHGPQSCSNDMQESKKYELQSLNSQTTIDAFYTTTELLSVRKTDRKLLSLYSSLLRKRIAHNKKYAYTQVEYLVDKSCKLNPTPISFKTQLCNQN